MVINRSSERKSDVKRRPRLVGVLAVLASGLAAGSAISAIVGAGGPALPVGADPGRYTAVDGTPVASLVPTRAPVLTLDGQPLLTAAGAQVTVPLGDAVRGEISEGVAEAQRRTADRLQREDACKRGIEIPIAVTVSGATEAESKALAGKALAEAVARNGGRKTVSAC